MDGTKLFISSCSRRQLQRRRLARAGVALRLQLTLALVAITLGFSAFVLGHGGI
jgi:hypothetical protein